MGFFVSWSVAITFIVVISYGIQKTDSSKSISIDEAPWQLSLQTRLRVSCTWNESGMKVCDSKVNRVWSHTCGASLIDKRWIVTGEHCVEDVIPTGYEARDLYRVVARVNDLRKIWIGIKSGIEQVFHLNNTDYMTDNFALVKLETPIENEPPFIQAIAVPSVDSTFGGQRCSVTGWGQTSSRRNSYILVETQVTVGNNDTDDCRAWGDLAANQACMLTDGCIYNEDNGGPLVCYQDDVPYLVATTTRMVKGCTPRYPILYIRVSYFKAFIESTIAANS